MFLFKNQQHYDRDGDGRLDAGEFALWELGNPQTQRTDTFCAGLCDCTEPMDLYGCWEVMQESLMRLASSEYQLLLPMMAHTLLRAMAFGLSQRPTIVPQTLKDQLDEFLAHSPLLRPWTAEQLCCMLPYEDEAALTLSTAGAFWQGLIRCMQDPLETDDFEDLSQSLSMAAAYCLGGDDGEAQRLHQALVSCYESHWLPTLPEA